MSASATPSEVIVLPPAVEAPAIERIDAKRRTMGASIAELWSQRALVTLLLRRDLRVRYKQTMVGGAWAILQPLVTMGALTAIFGSFAKMPSDGLPYALFSYAALVPWMYLANSLMQMNYSIVENRSLIARVYFPRMAIPLAVLGTGFMDFLVSFGVLVLMMVYYDIVPTVRVFAMPLVLLASMATTLGLGLYLAAMNVRFRDAGRLLPFMTQIWFFLTPIAYPSSVIPERWRWLAAMNPMTGVIEGFRWSLLGVGSPPGRAAVISAFMALLILVTGAYYFHRREDAFADLV